MASTNLILLVFISFLAVILFLSVYPSIEGIFVNTGAKIEESTGYSIDKAPAEQAKGELWAFMMVFLVMAAFVMLFARPRRPPMMVVPR